MDALEKFIAHNREAFDNATPPEDLWGDLQAVLPEQKTRPLYRNVIKWTARAAAAILIFASAWFLNDIRDHKAQQNTMAMDKSAASHIINELREAEAFYTARISQNKKRIASFASQQPGLMESVDMDLNELDAVYNELKKDLGDNAANQEVVEAMIQNYRLKLDILEQILEQLEEKSNNTNAVQNYEI